MMQPGDKRMSIWMKLIYLFVVANAYAGAISLIFFPGNTDSLFFWKITPNINAVLFGALYLVAGSVVLLAVIQGSYELARYLTPMIIPFSTLLLLATLMHLDKFTPGIKLYYWGAVYIVAPLATIFFYWQFERAGASWKIKSSPVKPLARWFAIILGALLTLYVLTSFILPDVIVNFWPWLLTPLLAQAFGAWLAALAGGLLWFGWERDWKRLQPLAYLMTLIPVSTLLVIAFDQADLKTTGLNLIIFVAALVGLGLCGVVIAVLQYAGKEEVSPQYTHLRN
jgi:hypothetical protein